MISRILERFQPFSGVSEHFLGIFRAFLGLAIISDAPLTAFEPTDRINPGTQNVRTSFAFSFYFSIFAAAAARALAWLSGLGGPAWRGPGGSGRKN